ncbi:MAG TPA: histidine kinase [Steroidobacteraceae bacterium]|nr:histidine kinase [Steroidobacteraceae bacterium]
MKPSINRPLFALWTLFWLLMITVSIWDHTGKPHIQWWKPLLWEGSSALAATALLLVERSAASRWAPYLNKPSRWFVAHLAWLPVCAIWFVVVIYAIRHAVYALAGQTYQHAAWLPLFAYEFIKFLLFSALWLAILFGLESFVSWRRERERLLQLQKHLAESQLAQLKAQLQPHFLFNALNTISALMQSDIARADRLLTKLADLLRASLTAGARQAGPLRDEIELLRLYADIMLERFAGRVTLDWRIADDVADAAVPHMLLQPLLENAFRHGVERSSQPVTIRIYAHRDRGQLRITLHNTGSSLAPGNGGTGIGLRNCRERLEVLYGSRASLDLAAEGDGVAARLTLPFEVAT